MDTPNAPVPPVPAPPTDPKTEARFTRLASLLDLWDADAQARTEAKATGKALGPVSGLSRLDSELAGALMPGLHHIHGQPGSGKTALALQIGANCGCPCLYITCEMSALELLRRITARVTGTFLGRFKTGELPPEEAGRLVRRAVADAANLALLDATEAPASAEQIGKLAAFLRPQSPVAPHLLIIIDSLNSWAEGAYPGMVEYEQLNAALADLRKIASHFACPILIINERNRASMTGGGQSAGAGSRKIEYGAESVIDLDRKPDAQPDANGEVDILLKLTKNRHGAPSRPMTLKFSGRLQRFQETPF